jgi:hypothetical protein
MLHRRIIALTAALLLALPGVSYAASATASGYSNTQPVVKDDSNSGSSSSPAPVAAAPTTASSGSSLPFTGAEVGLIAAAGLALAGTGFALRRASREDA